MIQFNQLLKLLNPFYGLSDSGNYFHAAVTTYLKQNLVIIPLSGNLACHLKLHGRLSGMLGNFVDVTTITEDRSFEKKSILTEHSFWSLKMIYDSSTYVKI